MRSTVHKTTSITKTGVCHKSKLLGGNPRTYSSCKDGKIKFKDRGRKLCKRFVGFIFGEVCVVYFGREPNNFTSFYMGTFHKG